METKGTTPRRGFITTVLGGAAAFGLSSVLSSYKVKDEEEPSSRPEDFKKAELWFDQIKNKKHKMVFDMNKSNNGAALSWALTLMDTYNDAGVPDAELGIVIILRYAGGPLAITDPLWEKYGFGKRLDIKDDETKDYIKNNPFTKCKTEDDDCFELFMKRGGLIGVCKLGTEHSAEGVAEQMKLDKNATVKEFLEHVQQGIQLVPTGIWALNRAQELGCTFCSAG